MSVKYFASSNQPVNKAIFTLSPATTIAVWTPATGKSIILTDVAICSAGAGTIDLFFTVDNTVPTSNRNLIRFLQGGSVAIKQHWDTPLIGTANEAIYFNGGGAGGSQVTVTLSGFEQD